MKKALAFLALILISACAYTPKPVVKLEEVSPGIYETSTTSYLASGGKLMELDRQRVQVEKATCTKQGKVSKRIMAYSKDNDGYNSTSVQRFSCVVPAPLPPVQVNVREVSPGTYESSAAAMTDGTAFNNDMLEQKVKTEESLTCSKQGKRSKWLSSVSGDQSGALLIKRRFTCI